MRRHTPYWRHFMATIAERLEKLTELSPADLDTLLNDLLDEFKSADEGSDLAKMTETRDQIRSVRAQSVRAEMAADNAAADKLVKDAADAKAAADAAEAAKPKDPEPAAETKPSTEVAEVETPSAPVVEGTPAVAPVTEIAPATVPADAVPVAAAASNTRVYAGADIAGVPAGYEFQDGKEFGKAMAKRIDTVMRMRGGDGEKVVIASLERTDIPSDRTLTSGDPFA